LKRVPLSSEHYGVFPIGINSLENYMSFKILPVYQIAQLVMPNPAYSFLQFNRTRIKIKSAEAR